MLKNIILIWHRFQRESRIEKHGNNDKLIINSCRNIYKKFEHSIKIFYNNFEYCNKILNNNLNTGLQGQREGMCVQYG